jgi:mannose-6-phosphate isomerase-like protein (cupin superfamily)
MPKRHRSVEELWFFIDGRGQMCIGDEAADVEAGTSVRIPPETRFQFRTVGNQPLEAVAVTMPPWPGPDEALDADPWWPGTDD